MTPANLSVPPKPPAPARPPDYVVKGATYPQWARAFAQFQKTLAVRSNTA